MRNKIITLTVLVALMSWVIQSGVNTTYSKVGGAPAKVAGGPAESSKTCAKSGCHTGKPVQTVAGLITSNIPNTGYIPGTTYTITATANGPGHTKFGFEVSPQNTSGQYKGTLIVTNTRQTKIVSTNYITHKSNGTSGNGIKSWSFNWKAPSAGSGPVTFYGAFNYSNNNGSESGDSIKTSTLYVVESPFKMGDETETAPQEMVSVKAYPNPFAGTAQLYLTTTDQSEVNWDVYSLNGQLIEHHEHVLTNTIIDIGNNWNEGVYLIRVQSADGIKTLKVVKSL